MTEARTGSQSIERAMAVLGVFSAADPDVGISDIATRVGLSTSTAHRIVRALVAGGLVEQGTHTDRYRLGHRAVVMGQIASHNLGMSEITALLRSLSVELGDPVGLGFLQGVEVVVAFRAEAAEPLSFDRRPGAREFAHASAMGKVLLAYSDSIVNVVASLGELTAFTSSTIVDPVAWAAELRTVRAQGFAVNNEERRAGASGVAVPVFDGDGRVQAALVAHGPSERFSLDRQRQLVAPLYTCAKKIGEALSVA